MPLGPLINRRLLLIGSAGTAALALVGCTKASPEPPHRNGIEIIGDGVADDASALQTFLARSAREGAELTLPAGSTLRLGSGIFVPSGARLNGNGSTLLNAAPGDGTSLLTVLNAQNIVLKNLVLDGNRAEYFGQTEQRHNVRLAGAQAVTLDHVRSRNAKGDGLYVGDQHNGPSTQIRVVDSTFENNYRQGMSITCCSGLALTRCVFSDTSGTAPSAGVDIEPNTNDSPIERIVFDSCTFTRNAGGGLLVLLSDSPVVSQSGGDYVNCNFDDNVRSDGIRLLRSLSTNFTGGQVMRNGGNGISIGDSPTDNAMFKGVEVGGNSQCGALITAPFNDLVFEKCIFKGNGNSGAKYFGIESSIAPRGVGRGFKVVGSTFADMHGGIQLDRSNLAPVIEDDTFAPSLNRTVTFS